MERLANLVFVDAARLAHHCPPTLPLDIQIPSQDHLFCGQGLSLPVHTGMWTLLGPNGSGKSQVMRRIKSQLTEKLERLGYADFPFHQEVALSEGTVSVDLLALPRLIVA